MASCTFPDIFSWINNLPPISLWTTSTKSIYLCSSTSSHPSLYFSVTKHPHSSSISFSIIADFNLPISLWTSKPLKLIKTSMPSNLLDEEAKSSLLINFMEDVLLYGPSTEIRSCLRFIKLEIIPNSKDIFNFTFLTLVFLICIYEAPKDLRSSCLDTIKHHLTNCQSRHASKSLMRLLGSNLEEQWMRSLNLAITNWIIELTKTSPHHHHAVPKTPSSLFSYAFSTPGLWKVQLYCPLIAMDIENSSNTLQDESLQFSLNFHQLEGVLQFNYKVKVQPEWVDLILHIDNIRCDVIRLVSETLLSERGVGHGEKYFPSRIALQLTPVNQISIISVSVSKSSENPTREIEFEKGIEVGFDAPTSLGLKVSGSETISLSLKPWKFEQSVYGYSAKLNWFLHDSVDGREVFSNKPSRSALINPKAWFKDRYSSAYRPFTREGGVVFAGDEYGQPACWKVDKSALGKVMEWEIRGWIWLTYWPNKYRTFHTETRRLEFREILQLTIA